MINYLEQSRTINGAYYAGDLRLLRQEMARKRRGKLTRGVRAPANTSQVALNLGTLKVSLLLTKGYIINIMQIYLKMTMIVDIMSLKMHKLRTKSIKQVKGIFFFHLSLIFAQHNIKYSYTSQFIYSRCILC